MNKQIRKNKTNQSVTWPKDTFFSFKELLNLNKDFIEITLRVRLTKTIENGSLVEIGSKATPHGRPEKMYCATPITKTILESATQKGIQLVDSSDKLIMVANISSSTQKDNKVVPKVVANTTAVNKV